MKALVSKLQEVIDNDNLPYFNGVVIELQPPYSESFYLGDSVDRNNPCYIKLLNGKFPDNSVEKPFKNLSSTLVPDNESQKILALCYPFDKLRVGPINTKARAKNIQDVLDWAGAGTTGLYFNSSYGYGDIEAVKNLTTLTTLSFSDTKISGDIEAVKNLTTLTTLGLSRTNVSGNIEAVKNLTALTMLSLSDTKISGDVNNINANKCYAFIDGTSIKGELSTVNCLVIAPSAEKFTWKSSSSRKAKGLTGLYILNYHAGAHLGNDVDNCLIDEASLNFPEIEDSIYKQIALTGTRTSASDDAVAKLKEKGISVFINGTKI